MVPKVRIAYHHYTSPRPPSFFFFFLIFPPFLPYFSLAFSFYGKAPGIFPSFNNFAKVSSHFLQHTVQSFTKSSEKSEGQEEEALPQGADTGFLTLSCFPNFICFLSFFPLLTLSAFAGADTSAKDLKPLVIEVAVEFAPNVQVVEA